MTIYTIRQLFFSKILYYFFILQEIFLIFLYNFGRHLLQCHKFSVIHPDFFPSAQYPKLCSDEPQKFFLPAPSDRSVLLSNYISNVDFAVFWQTLDIYDRKSLEYMDFVLLLFNLYLLLKQRPAD